MTPPRPRLRVGVVAADAQQTAMLGEWLRAAGYDAVPGSNLDGAYAAHLVVWPAAVDLARAAAPVVVLAPRGAAAPAVGEGRVAAVLALPDAADMKSLLDWSAQLTTTLRSLACDPAAARALPLQKLDPAEQRRSTPGLIAVGVSTGGPVALQRFLGSLRGSALPPMAIVQHIPTGFLGELVDRLAQTTGYRTAIAQDGETLKPGTAYFAPGDHHLRLVGDRFAVRARWTDEPARRGHRPAAEVLFESCHELDLRGIGVIMTGMGQDGAEGLLRLRQKGWSTLGQNEATCAIYGMPRAARLLGAVEREVPLDDLGSWLIMLCKPRAPQPLAR